MWLLRPDLQHATESQLRPAWGHPAAQQDLALLEMSRCVPWALVSTPHCPLPRPGPLGPPSTSSGGLQRSRRLAVAGTWVAPDTRVGEPGEGVALPRGTGDEEGHL